MTDTEWDLLLARIRAGNCTPFLGAGSCAGVLPLARELAATWSEVHEYPLDDSEDLARVAQYLAVSRDPMDPKERICEEIEKCSAPEFADPDEPHDVLAELPLPLYITTNYDDFMVRALKRNRKDPVQEVCRWNGTVRRLPMLLTPELTPTPANPLVFHLHGHCGIKESIVLTEEDYLDFLVAAIEDQDALLPHQIQWALSATSLLFVGYRLNDWDFRVLHRGLVRSTAASQRRISVTVQLAREQSAQRYLEDYFQKRMSIAVYWGDAREFAQELRQRWRAFESDRFRS
jgi:SIR2-like protein